MLPVRTILHPTDFSECSEAAFQVACSLAKGYQGRLIVIHVMPSELVSSRVIGGPTPNLYRAELEERLHRYEVPDLGLVVEHHLREGDPNAEILRAAEEFHCDMIVLGTHGRTAIGRLLMGSVAEAILHGAQCPVLIVKQPLPVAHAPHAGQESKPAIVF
jgi:nucleotide-binding universal stress UspA family protein